MCQQRGVRRNVKSSVKSGKHLENPPAELLNSHLCRLLHFYQAFVLMVHIAHVAMSGIDRYLQFRV